MKTQMKAMWAVLVMTTLWLTINSTKINSHIEEQKQLDTIVQKMVEELEETEVEEPVTFKETFKQMRDKYGADVVFKWEGNYYTTNYAEEVETHFDATIGGWVLNRDDLDDWCATNDRDDCGVCGGNGSRDWYADRDGDGLGDPATLTISCEEPSALNE